MRKFRLEKYKGHNSRHTCPACGRPRCFTYYVDDNGEIIKPEVGRCDHESSCGYHYTPREYFRDHPQTNIHHNEWGCSISPKKSVTGNIRNRDMIVNTISMDYVNRSVRPDIDSDFTTFLKTFLSYEQVFSLIDHYKLGVTSSGDVIFFEIDINGECRTGKVMKYDSKTGHRIKDELQPNRINWIHNELKRTNHLPYEWSVTQCLFGEHLLKRYPNKTVVLVEAEKTAVICSSFMPEYIWLATGGKSQFNDRVRVLAGRNVIAYPDLDATNEWRHKASLFPELNIRVSSIYSKFTTSLAIEKTMDIADLFIEWAKTKSK